MREREREWLFETEYDQMQQKHQKLKIKKVSFNFKKQIYI